MFEKLLLAGTITFSLNLFIEMGFQSPKQPPTIAQATPQPVFIAKVLHDSPLRGLLQ